MRVLGLRAVHFGGRLWVFRGFWVCGLRAEGCSKAGSKAQRVEIATLNPKP